MRPGAEFNADAALRFPAELFDARGVYRVGPARQPRQMDLQDPRDPHPQHRVRNREV